MRRSGIILPIFSLPSRYGIGTFGKEAYKFIDFLKEGGQKYWQILPIGPTSYGDSPYQSFSTFAGNPYFIDLELLCTDNILKESDMESYDFGSNDTNINYEKIYKSRYKVLKVSYLNGKEKYKKEVEYFKKLNENWIFDYALFMSLKDHFNGAAWKEWDKEIRFRKQEAMKYYSNILEEDINFYIFLQYIFFKQWNLLKIYANRNGIEIIGDIPIYVAEDSADTWSNQELFMLDNNLQPKLVSGCPPDAFSKTGQLWGNTIYNWEKIKFYGYKWWVKRIKAAGEIFNVIRIDHFRGFESYWSIPYGDKTALNGTWEKGPGIEIFEVIKKELGEINVIAEDLGYITNEVRELLDLTGYPGMRVLQFAFDPNGDSAYLPHNFTKNSVVYTGTHDNNSIKGWFQSLSDDEREFCKDYTCMKGKDDNWAFIRCAMSSVADTAIIQMQDVLNLGEESRINSPSTVENNWRWRMKKGDLTKELSQKLRKVTKIYRR